MVLLKEKRKEARTRRSVRDAAFCPTYSFHKFFSFYYFISNSRRVLSYSFLLVWNLIVSSLFVPLHCFWFSYSYIHHFSSVWSVHKLPSISFAFIYSFLSILFTFLIHSLISFYSSSVLIFIISLSTHVPLCSQSVPLARLSQLLYYRYAVTLPWPSSSLFMLCYRFLLVSIPQHHTFRANFSQCSSFIPL